MFAAIDENASIPAGFMYGADLRHDKPASGLLMTLQFPEFVIFAHILALIQWIKIKRAGLKLLNPGKGSLISACRKSGVTGT
jgi:hypothetical protein